ncbi:lysylphosphatidylglycerol synthase domain-containing protein [Solirubrobacter soli]|uniref:lysylphosphatidylglycerol synthase domain-containing protein n=1 Tax=Solirubrobacter soli TaxID=363832 RepID=UPI0027D30559|nr:lysylphosphatidylglycerol synthase domain-containing protein [Solirubrobacter soli]
MAAAVALIWSLPGVDEIRDRFASADPKWLVAAAVCRLMSMLGFVRALWSVFDRVMPWRRALELGLAEQGANVLVPAGGAGGPAFGAFVLTKIGVPAELAARRHAALFLLTSAVTFVAIFLAGILTTVHVLPDDVGILATLLPAIGAAVVIAGALWFAMSDPPHEPSGGRFRHLTYRLHRFVHGGARTSVELLRPPDPLLIYGSVAYFAFDVASLACVFQAFGGGAPPVGIFILAYSLGHAGAFIPTPGGVGGTEGGLIGMFVAYGTPLDLAAAAVLAYRVFQLGLPAIFGAFALLRVRHTLAHPPPREVVAARFAAVAREDETD